MSEPTHSYYDWQLSTLMLAYDVVEPIDRDDSEKLAKREEKVQHELRDMVHQVLPKDYLENPEAEFPPQIVAILTVATLQRAVEIVGRLSKQSH